MNNIEKLIYKARTQPKIQRALFQKLLATPLKVPAINLYNDVPDKKWRKLEQDEIARVKVEKDKTGSDVLVAFTSDKYFKKYMPEGGYYIAFHGSDLFDDCLLNKLNGIVINAKSELELEISNHELSMLVNRN